MTTTQLVLIIIFSIFLGLGLIALVVFNVIFLLKRHYINQSYKLDNKYNTYKINSGSFNIKAIETLVIKNNGLLPILTFLKKYHEVYQDQLEIVNIQLKNLIKTLKTYQLGKIKKQITQLKSNFDALDKQNEIYKNFNVNSQKYSTMCSSVATDMFSIISKITTFNRENMMNINYGNIEKIKKIDKSINHISSDINEEMNYINWEKIHTLFLKELQLINEYLKVNKDLYEIDRFRLSLDTICREIDKNLKAFNGSKARKIEFEKQVNQAHKNSKALISDLEDVAFDTVIKTYKKELFALEKILREVNVENVYERIYTEHINTFKQDLDSFFHIIEHNEIKNLYNDIKKNFGKYDNIKQLVIDNNNSGLRIVNEIEQFNKSLTTSDGNINYEKILNSIINVYQLIIIFKHDNDELFKLISKRNSDLTEMIFIINDLSVKLMDIERLIVVNKVKSRELQSQLHEKQSIVEELKQELTGNFNIKDPALTAKVESVNTFIDYAIEIIREQKELTEIIRLLRTYANRFATEKNTKIFAEFDKLYRSREYDLLIDEYIKFIGKQSKAKKVA